MDNQVIQSIKNALDKNEPVGIIVGENATLDEMGAALAFYLSLKQANKTVTISYPVDPLVELSSLVGINKLKKNLGGENGGDLVVSFPYKEGEIEKVSYTLEEGFLNIVVKSGQNGLSFSENEIQFKHKGGYPTTLFVIGTPRLSDLGSLFDPEGLKNTTVINIDNKIENQNFGDIIFVSPEFSSVSEQISTVIKYLNLNFDIDIAQNLMSGISYATKNFQDPKTSLFAFEQAAFLMKKGAVRSPYQSRPQFQSQSRSQDQDLSFNDDFFPKEINQPAFNQNQAQLGQNRFNQNPAGVSQNQPRIQPKWNQPRSQQPRSSQNVPSKGSQTFNQNQVGAQNQNQDYKKQDQSQPKKVDEKNPPDDWLTPKIYKGSTSI